MSDYRIGKTGKLTSYNGAEKDVIIPKETKIIGDSSFAKHSEIESITFPKGLEVIEMYAFRGCMGIKIITLPDGVTKIGDYAFSECKNLEEVRLPKTLKSISIFAFAGCENLEKINIPDCTEIYAFHTFDGCIKLQDENGFIVLDGCLCGYLKDEKEIVIPDGVSRIAAHSLDHTSIEYAEIHGSPAINNTAFGKNSPAIWFRDLSYGDIPKAFLKNAAAGFIKKYSEGDNGAVSKKSEYLKYLRTKRKEYYSEALLNPGLLKLFIEEKFLELDDADELLNNPDSTAECRTLLLNYRNSFSEKEKVDKLEKDMGIRELSVSELKKIWRTEKLKNETLSIKAYKGADEEIKVPAMIGKQKVTAIGDEAFNVYRDRISAAERDQLRKIKSIEVPDGVIKIGAYAFDGCSAVSIVLPDGLKTIGDCAFMNCIKLESLRLPSSLKKVGERAFGVCCNLTIHAPAGSYAEQYAKENNIPFVAE